MTRKFVVASALAVLAGCATVSQMQATGGSRSDGIVKLSFEYGMFDKVQLDESSALLTARQRCAVWGYTDADPFGGITRQCQAYSGTLGCTHWFVTKEYQCTMGGGGAPPLAQASVPGPALAPSPMPVGSGGPRMVRAKTSSGYCLDVPPGYRGTGAANSPAVTSAMPRCDQLSDGKSSSALRRY
jgi:hypothetical protein